MQKTLLAIARNAILDQLNQTSTIDTASLKEKFSELSKPKATFVTLTLDGGLRGCIGSLIAHRAFLDDLIHNAKAAAFEDPRFYPLTKEEFEKTHIEISILTEPEVVEYTDTADLKSKIVVGVDGIILQLNDRRSTFLPQVWEQIPTFEQFFSHLCQKAGLDGGCLEKHPRIWRYRAEKIK